MKPQLLASAILAAVFAALQTAMASNWPTHDFDMIIGDTMDDTSADITKAENQRALIEGEAEKAAKFFDDAGFVAPRLFPNKLYMPSGNALREYSTPPTAATHPNHGPYEITLESVIAAGGEVARYVHNACEDIDVPRARIEIGFFRHIEEKLQRAGHEPLCGPRNQPRCSVSLRLRTKLQYDEMASRSDGAGRGSSLC